MTRCAFKGRIERSANERQRTHDALRARDPKAEVIESYASDILAIVAGGSTSIASVPPTSAFAGAPGGGSL